MKTLELLRVNAYERLVKNAEIELQNWDAVKSQLASKGLTKKQIFERHEMLIKNSRGSFGKN